MNLGIVIKSFAAVRKFVTTISSNDRRRNGRYGDAMAVWIAGNVACVERLPAVGPQVIDASISEVGSPEPNDPRLL